MKAKKLTVCRGSGQNYASIPKIVLQGQWLHELGFSIGDKVDIDCQQGKIIITKQTERY